MGSNPTPSANLNAACGDVGRVPRRHRANTHANRMGLAGDRLTQVYEIRTSVHGQLSQADCPEAWIKTIDHSGRNDVNAIRRSMSNAEYSGRSRMSTGTSNDTA